MIVGGFKKKDIVSQLFIIATPIGNLQDFTDRARQIMGEVDVILAEDTRVTRKLLSAFEIPARVISFHEHSSDDKVQKIVSEMDDGHTYALVSDAGTPAVSDPGAKLIDAVLQSEHDVIPIPGVSAVTTLVSVFGKPETFFHFWGFFPIKNKKKNQLMDWMQTIPGIHVFFESPFRILKTLEKYFTDEGWHVVVGREMTKKFETFYRGTPFEVMEALKADSTKGEFCVGVIKEKSGVRSQESE